MAANWNFAVNSCSGKWVGMLSGDDKVLPGYVRSIRRIVSGSDNAVFAYGGWNVVNADTGELNEGLSCLCRRFLVQTFSFLDIWAKGFLRFLLFS